jgi:hypothetical protein
MLKTALASALLVLTTAGCAPEAASPGPAPLERYAVFAGSGFSLDGAQCYGSEPQRNVARLDFGDTRRPELLARVDQSLADRRAGKVALIDLTRAEAAPVEVSSEECSRWDVALDDTQLRGRLVGWRVQLVLDCPMPGGGRLRARADWDACE